MRQKGFTLIELLAVIVILAIIALIAIPTTSGILSKAKKSSAESSAMGYLESVEQTQARNLLNNDDSDNLEEGIYSLPLDQYNIKVKGQVPTKGWIEITKNGIGRYSLLIGDYTVSYNGTEKNVVKGSNLVERPKIYPEYVYAQPTSLTKVGRPIDANVDLGEKYVVETNGFTYAFDTEQECIVVSQQGGLDGSCSKQRYYTPNLDYLVSPKSNWNGYVKFKLTTDGLIDSAEVCYKNNECLNVSSVLKSENDIRQELSTKYPELTEVVNEEGYARIIDNKICFGCYSNSHLGMYDFDNQVNCGVFINGMIACQKTN